MELKTYVIKYEIHEEIKAKSGLDALIIHQDYLAEKLGSMFKEIVWEKKKTNIIKDILKDPNININFKKGLKHDK